MDGQHGFRFPIRVRDRDKVFLTIAEKVPQAVLYLEFGVFQGDSMRYWSRALKHPESMLHGFDSFEGLPEDWDESGHNQKGAYSAQGQIPVIDDPRVKFFKGWFDQVLPTYTVPDHEVLVVFMDADLYSSTICGLRHLRLWIKPGTYIYFDNMSHPDHEPRAFDEFMKETGLRFDPVVANKELNYASFECVG